MKSSHPRSSILDPRSSILDLRSSMTLLPQTVLFLLVPDISEPKELSPLQILQLVGFATGAALHLYLCLMVYRRYGFRGGDSRIAGCRRSLVVDEGVQHNRLHRACLHASGVGSRAFTGLGMGRQN